jgi:hypothetical protein
MVGRHTVSIGTGHAAARADPEPGGRRPGRRWKLALIGVVGVFIVLACYDLVSVSGQYGSGGSSASSTARPTVSQAKARPSAAIRAVLLPVVRPATTLVPHALDVASVAAFGPEGITDGDNPGTASRILDVGTDQPWYSHWYATPEFGDLQSGTGLLLDMGQTVTVTDVRLVLGSAPGADVQLRVGNSPSLDTPPVASASGAGGNLQLAVTAPAKGRYVLIWFTRLPPAGQGHYQVSVYSVVVDG